ncbi:MAG: bifunctional riboflavin kinase/FAD synthetase [Methylophilaceae bacterium]|nr:bifunctional riboflavin kinase/FAD synthetase [Methylophilaceae bacterium]
MKIIRNTNLEQLPCVVTIGNFDGVHLGHQALLTEVKKRAHDLKLESAVITFEPNPKDYFSQNKPQTRISSLREKIELFNEIKIDRVHIIKFNQEFSKVTANEFISVLIKQLKVKEIVVGEDFCFGRGREGGIKQLSASSMKLNIKNKILMDGKRISSTLIRNLLANDKLDQANKYIGRPYSISGKVVHGEKRGRKIGFPTANIHMRHNRPPLKGVFAVKFQKHFGVANLGIRPSIKGEKKLQLEVHLLNFSSDLYGQHVSVIFLKKLRDEKKFKSLDELKEQIKLDVIKAKLFFDKKNL